MRSTAYGPEHDAFRKLVRDFLNREVVDHFPDWEQAGVVPREVFVKLGELGIPGLQVPERYGGGGATSFKYNAIVSEETARAGVSLGGLSVHMNVVLPYFLAYGDEEQKARWLPGLAGGELMSSIAMTEPGTGSDLAGMSTTARREGGDYVLNGAKTFITGGINADLVLVVARTGRGGDRRDGLSLLVVERGMPGFERGRNLDKLGLKAQDTAELSFTDVRVPAANLLGAEGAAFGYLTGNLPQERLSIAVAAQAAAEAALETTLEYVRERRAFGTPVSSFQNTKFELAACATEIEAGRALLDRALGEHDDGALSGADAAKVKIFCTELQARVVDRCLQLHGGYGYIREYRIARLYADARVTRIFGGTTEVLKTIVAKSLGL
ncbi:long-chain-acyl-CoA dehydrogenase [Saccharopolyspora erythraea NRRL 2338]|uniref:Acyl-[acyl-carrier-protein] dehydrogenase MbtN n=2 Tax=Saccharopolyspora erythraea TaxID=1836 RepID=A4FGT9_SACEN|nr:acyl-CoA dehydrogenase family protein [Saccharopolyspora erythraea]EQD82495.1 acyl-CoA dehydrogenase [Saccharopolyspora erythraea D]PFG96968.1 long-chain-acyl-CoA dehydrogenase [Saccharopolyspora erythraea NRRL 2338]QRK87186.1 acyl-CoA dehydrogenase family protein [Saccharopolyspora erythraea]CAM03264.1 long-chain-acyl-CoA dehydrogenase [Saccharopolyspora erythraea NRRL 2338]